MQAAFPDLEEPNYFRFEYGRFPSAQNISQYAFCLDGSGGKDTYNVLLRRVGWGYTLLHPDTKVVVYSAGGSVPG